MSEQGIYDTVDGVAQRLAQLVYEMSEFVAYPEDVVQALEDEVKELTEVTQRARALVNRLAHDRGEKAVADLTDEELEIRQVTRRMDDE